MASARYRLLTREEFQRIINDGTAIEALKRYVQRKRGPKKTTTPDAGSASGDNA
jgi:hypothetical protein